LSIYWLNGSISQLPSVSETVEFDKLDSDSLSWLVLLSFSVFLEVSTTEASPNLSNAVCNLSFIDQVTAQIEGDWESDDWAKYKQDERVIFDMSFSWLRMGFLLS